MVIVFEGVDGAGKSTLMGSVAKCLGAVRYKTPPEPYRSLKSRLPLVRLESCKTPTERLVFLRERMAFFTEANLKACHDIKKMQRDGISVVVDRWYLTTMAYHFALAPELEGEMICAPERFLSIMRPEHVFLIHVSDASVWRERMTHKHDGGSYIDRLLLKQRGLPEQIEANYRRLSPSIVEVDNSGSPDIALRKIISVVNGTRHDSAVSRERNTLTRLILGVG